MHFFKKRAFFQKPPHFQKPSFFQKSTFFKNRTFSKITCFKAIKRTVHTSRSSCIMAENTLNEWSDGEDDFVWQIDENLWEWNNPEDDDLIRNIDENDILGQPIQDDLIPDSNLQNEPIQTGRGEKRKSDEPRDAFYGGRTNAAKLLH